MWYLDTWAPRDGIAFASHWSGRDVNDRGDWLATVSLRPPYWRPVPVGPATARRAERGGFQAGFFGKEGPIGFDTLEDLFAVVRQAYIGGGLPPESERGAEAEPGFPPDFPGPTGCAWESLRQQLLEGDDPTAFAVSIQRSAVAELESLFERIAIESVTHMVRSTPGAIDPQDVWDWIRLTIRMGIWHDPRSVWDEFYERGLYEILYDWEPHFLWSCGGCRKGLLDDGLIFRVPHPGDYRYPSLGHQLLQALGNRAYFEEITWLEFGCVFFSASAIVAAAGRPGYGWPAALRCRDELRRDAAVWIMEQRPTVDSGSQAGQALDRFVRGRHR